MKLKEVVKRLVDMEHQYASERIWEDPSKLTDFMAEFAAYASILYSTYGEFIETYRKEEAKITSEESDEQTKINEGVEKRDERRTNDEVERRITIRLSNLKGMREKIEATLKGAEVLRSTMQTKQKAHIEEAKGTI